MQTFSVPNVPPNTTRHTMHWGTALPLTRCSNKAEGHSSCQCCSQSLARRTNGGLFSIRPPPCCPARPHSTRGGQRRCVSRCLVRWQGEALPCGFFSFSRAPNRQSSFLNVDTVVLSCYIWTHQKFVASTFSDPDLRFKKHSDTHTGLQLFVKWLPASPGRPRVQLIPHAWAKYHLCLFGNKGGTC